MVNFYSDGYHSSVEDLSACTELFGINSPNCLPANYSNFMNWSSPHKIVVQGITEPDAAMYAVQMKAYGTEIIAGVSPGRGGTMIEDIPVFDLVEQVLNLTDKIDISLIFVPPYQVLDAAKEAIDLGIERVIILTSDVPPQDTIQLIKYARASNTLLLGPGSQGIIIPDRIWLGQLLPQFYQRGNLGLITTSQYLSYEVAAELNRANLGQSMVVSLGDEPIIGSNLSQWLSILNLDPDTEAIIFIGKRISDTEEIVRHCQNNSCDKPVIVYLVGLKTPQARMFRDAVTIISNHLSASIPAVNQEKQLFSQLKKLGIKVAQRPQEISQIVLELVNQNT